MNDDRLKLSARYLWDIPVAIHPQFRRHESAERYSARLGAISPLEDEQGQELQEKQDDHNPYQKYLSGWTGLGKCPIKKKNITQLYIGDIIPTNI